ncbi:lyzozyme M1 [Weissella oryzae SG25]|uniref:Lyzozyme M1 n=1 Tax=Weissella oryzae (strain DSM 25784 / JCM 18191 / LMG 30913 / SG25) TaxID=1329250 RepID=A0A069CTH7_WEIOS|nr:GH25 family lysozyme [Weissella oryzae]GAK30558.1 lyzozyme M1 [Weissella oryzae SG25]
MLNGIDISNYQADLNVGVIGADFVIVKATEGLNYINPVADQHYQQAKAASKLLGVYHFMTADDPRAQAEFFVNNVGGYVGEAVLVLDFEAGGLALGSNGAKVFLDRVKELTGVAPLIYMSKCTINQMDWSAVAPDYGLWAAQYANYARTGYLSDPWTDDTGWGAWGQPALFQYSSSGALNGYAGNLDLDIAYMDADAWHKFAGKDIANPDINNGPQPQLNKVVDQVLNVGDNFSFTDQIYRVDELKMVHDFWQFISYELAGGNDANWENNGVPAAIVDEVTVGTLSAEGQDQVLQVGSYAKFKKAEPWTVLEVNAESNGVKVDTDGYGTLWLDATTLTKI